MNEVSGVLEKMETSLGPEKVAQYHFVLGENKIALNPLLGQEISLTWSKEIFCLDTGEKIKKSFGQGYSYKSFMKLPQCDLCYVKPELCHFAKGTCRDPKWGEAYCNQPHYLYLSLTSGVKVGITKASNIPCRWIDQGATLGQILFEFPTRHFAGILEKEISSILPDKTHWQKMLKGEVIENEWNNDFSAMKEMLIEQFADLLDDYQAKEIERPLIEIKYPLLQLPSKVTSLDFEKTAEIKGRLLGIKGQYLILDCGVLNVRKFGGYQITLY